MIIRVIRIILSGIIFCYDRIGNQIQKQTAVTADQSADDLIQIIFSNDTTQYKECPDPKAATAAGSIFYFRKLRVRKIFQEICIRIHHIRITIRTLTYGSVYRHRVFFAGIVSSAIGIVNIGNTLDCFS